MYLLFYENLLVECCKSMPVKIFSLNSQSTLRCSTPVSPLNKTHIELLCTSMKIQLVSMLGSNFEFAVLFL